MDINNEIDALIQAGRRPEAVRLIEKGIDEGADLSRNAVTYGHFLIRCFNWIPVLKLIPFSLNHLFSSGWIMSIASGRPINKDNQPIPWITYPAIDFLDSIVTASWNVFEWGSGNSTLWWARRVASVLAVEHDQPWMQELASTLPENAKVRAGTNLEEYLGAYRNAERERFDVVVIDGEYRNECAAIACDRLAEGGIIIFDNSDNLEFDEGIRLLTEKGFIRLDFWGMIPRYTYKNCTSVFLSDPEILKRRKRPCWHVSSVGPSCAQVVDEERKRGMQAG